MRVSSEALAKEDRSFGGLRRTAGAMGSCPWGSTAFFKTLETYKEAAYKNAFVIFGTDSDYYRFLKTIPK